MNPIPLAGDGAHNLAVASHFTNNLRFEGGWKAKYRDPAVEALEGRRGGKRGAESVIVGGCGGGLIGGDVR